MSLPGSYLDTWASQRDIPRLPLQLDGGSGTGGRMSAPGTRVFLLPVALWLAAQPSPPAPLPEGEAGTRLHSILRRAWDAYAFDEALAQPVDHRYVRLAAALSGASVHGANAIRPNIRGGAGAASACALCDGAAGAAWSRWKRYATPMTKESARKSA